MIDTSTNLVGILGWPLEHSFSPMMHNAAFDALMLNWRYLPFPVSADRFQQALKGLMALGILGLNITIPYKQTVIPHLTSLDETARQIGAVNTIAAVKGDAAIGHYRGYNTDIQGFINALKTNGFDEFESKNVVIVGAGGAARAVIYSLIKENVKKITILNRNQVRGQAIVDEFQKLFNNICSESLTPDLLVEKTSESDLLVNATPVGTYPFVGSSIWPENIPMPSQTTIFDLVYNPSTTKLLKQAIQSQVAFIGGLDMLIHQGALSFNVWTGLPAPVGVMRKACHAIIGGEHV